MKFVLSVDMDNAAFDGNKTGEVRRILQDLTTSIRKTGLPGSGYWPLTDANGNKVGQAEIVEQ